MRPTSQEKKEYEVELARHILLHFFPNKYVNTVLSEAPDIISADNNLGVEVTNSHSSAFREQMSRASRITGKSDNELTETDRQNIELGRVVGQASPNGQYLSAFFTGEPLHQIQESYTKKLQKLNSPHFKKCRENHLFIFAWLSDEEDVSKDVEEILSFSASAEMFKDHVPFENVYIFSGLKLLEIKLATGDIVTHSLSANELKSILNDVHFTVFGRTREEERKTKQRN